MDSEYKQEGQGNNIDGQLIKIMLTTRSTRSATPFKHRAISIPEAGPRRREGSEESERDGVRNRSKDQAAGVGAGQAEVTMPCAASARNVDSTCSRLSTAHRPGKTCSVSCEKVTPLYSKPSDSSCPP